MVHAQEETEHSEKIAERIVQLGGEPDFSPAASSGRSHADYDESTDLMAAYGVVTRRRWRRTAW